MSTGWRTPTNAGPYARKCRAYSDTPLRRCKRSPNLRTTIFCQAGLYRQTSLHTCTFLPSGSVKSPGTAGARCAARPPRRRWERGRLVRPGIRGDERRTGGDAPALRGWLAPARGRPGRTRRPRSQWEAPTCHRPCSSHTRPRLARSARCIINWDTHDVAVVTVVGIGACGDGRRTGAVDNK